MPALSEVEGFKKPKVSGLVLDLGYLGFGLAWDLGLVICLGFGI